MGGEEKQLPASSVVGFNVYSVVKEQSSSMGSLPHVGPGVVVSILPGPPHWRQHHSQ